MLGQIVAAWLPNERILEKPGYPAKLGKEQARRAVGSRSFNKSLRRLRGTFIKLGDLQGMKESNRLRPMGTIPVRRSPQMAEHAPREHYKRRRRSPDVAESEILDAAERLLRRMPFRKLTIGGLMAKTGLRRPSFYQYFDDLYQVLEKLAQRHVKVLSQYTQRYADHMLIMSGSDVLSEESAALRREQLINLCKAHRKDRHFHRLLLRSSALDPAVRRIYRSYIRGLAQHTADLIRQLQGRGFDTSLDPDETALALELMVENYVFEKIVDDPASDLEKVADTIKTIWEKVMYGEIPRFRSPSMSEDKDARDLLAPKTTWPPERALKPPRGAPSTSSRG